MSDITVINDSEQSSLVTNGLAKNGELYLKAAGSTNAGAIVAYDSGVWRTFANEAVSFQNQYSVVFDGSNDHMTLASTTSGAGAYTLSFWIRPLGGAEGWVLFGTSGEYISYYGSVYGNRLLVRNMGTITTAVDSIMVNNWYHVFLVRDSSNNVELFINGSSAGTSTFSGTLAFNKILNPSYGMYGHFDEIAFFNSDQSANLSSIYNSGVPGDLSSYSPTHWWRMGDDDSGSGTTITDQGSGSNNGTLTNGPTFSTTVPS